jgi:hypothetical protein
MQMLMFGRGTVGSLTVPEKPGVRVSVLLAIVFRLARRTLVTLGVIVLQADLELDRLQEVALLGVVAVVEELSNILTHTGCKVVSLGIAKEIVDGGECLPTVILDILTVFLLNSFQ